MTTVAKDRWMAAIYLSLTTLLTGLFVAGKFWLYNSTTAMLLSGGIAVAKWLIQLIAALILLKNRKWEFIRGIGWICFIGSCVLFSYNILASPPLPVSGFSELILSVILAVVIMGFLYYRLVRTLNLSMWWFWSWLFCLAIALWLQASLFFLNFQPE